MTDDTAREEMHKTGPGSQALERFPDTVLADSHGQEVLYVQRRDWRPLAQWLRDEAGFEQCVDLTAVDQLLRPGRPLPPGVVP
ncbi:MAG: hypothetical protein ACRD0O_15495, partial [Acidimicrobiia bacterium]